MNPALMAVGAAAAVVAKERVDAANADPKVKAYRAAVGATVAAAVKALQDAGATGRNRASFTIEEKLDHPGWKESGVKIPVSDTVKKHVTERLAERGFTVDRIEAKDGSIAITARQKVGMVKGLGWSILGAVGR
jgi:hypothetical protein